MQSSLHNQKTASEVYSFVIFEDQIFDKKYLNVKGHKIRSELILRLNQTPFNKRITHNNLPPLADLELTPEQMLELIRWFRTQLSQFEPSLPIAKRLEYIILCLENCVDQTQSVWGNKNIFTIQYCLTTLNVVDRDNNVMKFRSKNPNKYSSTEKETNFQKGFCPQIAFWCFDSDGLQLNETLLNRGKKISVTPLQRFFDPSKKNSTKFSRIERYCHHPQRISSIQELSAKENIGRPAYQGTDHFVILLTPNLEICSYRLEKDSKPKLQGNMKKEYDLDGEKVSGFDLFIGNSRLSSAPFALPQNVKLNPDFHDEILDIFLNGESISHNWSEKDIPAFLKFLLPGKMSKTIGQGYIAAGLYLKKSQKVGGIKFPIPRTDRLDESSISENIRVYKWSSFAEPTPSFSSNGISSKVNRNGGESKKITRYSAWSKSHRCNGKTNIPLHPDFVSKEILDRYGTDVYGGFKPCQRIVKNKLRCRDHISDVSHEF